jgi:hypothetical protein
VARFLADENFPYPVTEELRRLGHDVATMVDLGKANQAVSDEEVLSIAAAQGRTVLSHNRRHFIRLHNTSAGHSGIVVCTFDPNFVRQASRISEAIATSGDLAGKLIRVNRPSV